MMTPEHIAGAAAAREVAGRICYEAYAAAVNWTAYDGKTIAQWSDQDADRRAAWCAGAAAVAAHTKAALADALSAAVREAARAASEPAPPATTAAIVSAQDAAVPPPTAEPAAEPDGPAAIDPLYAARHHVYQDDVVHNHGDGQHDGHLCGGNH